MSGVEEGKRTGGLRCLERERRGCFLGLLRGRLCGFSRRYGGMGLGDSTFEAFGDLGDSGLI